MDDSLFSKCEIIASLVDAHGQDPMWQPFFDRYDVGVPLARLICVGCAEATDPGEEAIEEAWVQLCRIIMVDADTEYESLEHMAALVRSMPGGSNG